jgi:hypothetical protein
LAALPLCPRQGSDKQAYKSNRVRTTAFIFVAFHQCFALLVRHFIKSLLTFFMAYFIDLLSKKVYIFGSFQAERTLFAVPFPLAVIELAVFALWAETSHYL